MTHDEAGKEIVDDAERCACSHFFDQHELGDDSVSHVCIVPGCDCHQFRRPEEPWEDRDE